MDAGPALRVLIVDDSVLFRQSMVAQMRAEHGFELLEPVATGREAIACTQRYRPHLVTLDLELPDMDGFDVVRHIMSVVPTPIVVMTATLRPPWRKEAFFALSLGALDVIQKPTGAEAADASWWRRFYQRLRQIARSPVVPHVAFKLDRLSRWTTHAPSTQPARISQRRVVAPASPRPELAVVVGSAGSLRAVNVIFEALGRGTALPVPLVLAFHMGPGMEQALAGFLRADYGLQVRIATVGERPAPGVVHVAPGGAHLTMDRGTFQLDDAPRGPHVPDLSHLLNSVAKAYGPRAVGVMLSGMGTDGVDGMLSLRRAGATTLAQSPDACLASGMPASALAAGAIDQDAPPQELAALIWRAVVAPSPSGGDDR
jgi:two-component system chemotaxis response regulator CheB